MTFLNTSKNIRRNQIFKFFALELIIFEGLLNNLPDETTLNMVPHVFLVLQFNVKSHIVCLLGLFLQLTLKTHIIM